MSVVHRAFRKGVSTSWRRIVLLAIMPLLVVVGLLATPSTATAKAPDPPTITEAPQPLTVAPFTAFSLTASATSGVPDETVAVDLQQSDDDGLTWGSLSDYTVSSGSVQPGYATVSNYFGDGVPASAAGRLYRAVASSYFETVTSTPARLTVITATTTDLQISLAGPATATHGSTVTYTATVANTGWLTATDVTTAVSMTGLGRVTVSPTPTGAGTVRIGPLTVNGTRWTGATLRPGETTTYQITGVVTARPGQTLAGLAGTFTATPKDPNLDNNVATALTRVT